MVLRNQVEWALHCCSILAAMPPGKYIPTKDLAQFHGVPKEYLSKALQALAQADILEGTLGPTGGYRLKRTAEKISFLDVVEAIEGPRTTFKCTEIRMNNPCLKKGAGKSGTCAIARTMYRADEAWRDTLRTMTLADLAKDLVADLPKEHLERSHGWFTTTGGANGR